MNMYYVSLSTGALVQGIYSSLDKAKEAVVLHYRKMCNSGQPEFMEHVLQNMEWIEVTPGSWAWCPIGWDTKRNVWGQNNTIDMVFEDVAITAIELDYKLPIV